MASHRLTSSEWPEAERIQDIYMREVRSALAVDPAARLSDADLDVVDDMMARFPDHGEALWGWFGDGDRQRYAALKTFIAATAGTSSADRTFPAAHVADGDVVILMGGVQIAGNLVLGSQAMLWVLGPLTIDGHLIADPWDYSLLGAAHISMQSGFSPGELMATDAIVASGALYLAGNDYGCRTPRLAADVLVDFERSHQIPCVEAAARCTSWDFDAAARSLGLDPDAGDLRRGFHRKLSEGSR